MRLAGSGTAFGLASLLIATAGCAGHGGVNGAGGASGGGGAGGTGGTGGTGGSTATSGSGGSAGQSGVGGSGTGGASTGGVGAGGTGTGGTAGSHSGTGGAAGAGTGGAAGASPSGGSGGSASGGRGGAGGAAGATAACPYKLCEGFESGTVGGIPTGWTMLKGYGAGSAQDVGLATDQVHSGAMSLKSSSMATGQNRVQKALASLGAVATKHWGRIFYKAQAVKPTSGVLHVTFVALEGTTEDRVVDTVEQTDGTHQWIYNIPNDSCCPGSDYNWSFDNNWHCAEWYVDATAESYRFFTDGTEVTQLAFTGNAAAMMSAWTDLAVGEIFYQQPPSPFVLWFDDLAINDTQIGCQ